MGCDIHMYVEYKHNKKWINGDYFKHNKYYEKGEPKLELIELHGNRNYNLFSTLAGVRDYSGKVIPVSEPKGLPENISKEVKKYAEQWDGDAHTHSWLTLKELKEYQKTEPIMHYSGLLSPNQVLAFDSEGTLPEWWCQGTNQEGYERREWSVPNDNLEPLIEKLQKRAHELMQWDWQEYNEENDKNIRIVFWFDN